MDTLRTLVVDDEPGMRTGVERVLRHLTIKVPEVGGEVGFAVEEAADGESALTSIAETPFDLVLLDYKLPGIDGLQVLDRLRDRVGDMAVIMITAYVSLETAISATKRGAFDVLPKPFTPDELQVAVRKAATWLLLQRRARQLAEERRRVRFEFVRVLGHELKSPLAAVEGYLNILHSATLGDQIAPYHDCVDRSLVRLGQMRKLIADLLDMTQLESGTKRRDLAELDLREVASAAIEVVAAEAAGRGIAAQLVAPERLPFTADRGEMDMLFNNLVSNAVKYNRDRGTVTVTLARTDLGVRVAVADTGIGMTTDEVAKLFGEFVRIKNAKTRNILGSGLGLSVVKRLVQLYEGEVTVASVPDVGTTFAVVLKPASAKAEEPRPASGTFPVLPR
jgi:signal transduction histidine kinase